MPYRRKSGQRDTAPLRNTASWCSSIAKHGETQQLRIDASSCMALHSHATQSRSIALPSPTLHFRRKAILSQSAAELRIAEPRISIAHRYLTSLNSTLTRPNTALPNQSIAMTGNTTRCRSFAIRNLTRQLHGDAEPDSTWQCHRTTQRCTRHTALPQHCGASLLLDPAQRRAGRNAITMHYVTPLCRHVAPRGAAMP